MAGEPQLQQHHVANHVCLDGHTSQPSFRPERASSIFPFASCERAGTRRGGISLRCSPTRLVPVPRTRLSPALTSRHAKALRPMPNPRLYAKMERSGKEPMKPALQVMKFGGTSVGDADCIRRVASIVHSAATKHPVVVVVSAMSGVTNRLVQAAHRAEARRTGRHRAVGQ